MGSLRFSEAVPQALNQMSQSNVIDGGREQRARSEAADIRNQARNDKAIEQMLKDPANAQAISRAWGVPITPELDALLKQPAAAQKVLEASKLAEQMGIENPEARKVFAQKYMETGDLIAAGQAIEGIDPRKPMSPYQEAYLDVARTKARSAGTKAVPIPATFVSSVEGALDKLRGVRYANRDHTALLEGSAAPLAPETLMLVANRAAVITQQTRNPVAALQQAYQEIGGEAGLVDAEDSPYVVLNAQGIQRGGRIKYKRAQMPEPAPGGADNTDFDPATVPQTGGPMPPRQAELTLDVFGGTDGSDPEAQDQYQADLSAGLQPLPEFLPAPAAPGGYTGAKVGTMPPAGAPMPAPAAGKAPPARPQPAAPVEQMPSVTDWKNGTIPAPMPRKSYKNLF